MTDPDVLKVYPYWQYVHGLRRVPDSPREEHEAWDGLILRADDPWWETYYPPNGWKCGCGVRPVSRTKLKKLGKSEPDPSPVIETEERRDPGTDEWIRYPKGVDMGWAYAPGRTWADGLVPRELQKPLGQQMELPGLERLPALKTFAKPVAAPLLDKGLPEEDYVRAFLTRFDADIDDPALFRDKAGHVIVVGEDLFRTPTGDSKLFGKAPNVGFFTSRAIQLARLAEALKDPDEVWIDWEWHKDRKRWFLKRRYLRASPDLAGLVVFEWSQTGWRGTTAYNAESGKKAKRKPNFNQLETWRHGALLYRRPQNEKGS